MRRVLIALGKVLLFVTVLAAFVVALPERPGESTGKHGHHAAKPFHCAVSSEYPKGTPCRISIPAIGVTAKVIRLGLNPDGTLQVPTDFSQTGWWSGGTKPGNRGPAVIVGHIDSKAGPAVFYRLHELQAGDLVKVWRAGESMVEFRVTGKGEWPKADFPSELVYGPIPYPGLRLITCGGTFDESTGHYVDNIIVFGRLVSS